MTIRTWYSAGMTVSWSAVAGELRRRRLRARMTQAALAKAARTTPNTVAMCERGERRPSIDLLGRLARALGCRVRDLLKENGRGKR